MNPFIPAKISRTWWLLAGIFVFLLSLFVTAQLAYAGPPLQDDATEAEETDIHDIQTTQDCQECHLDVSAHWQDSAHAHAYDDPFFQQSWQGLGKPDECLACHTTNYSAATGTYDAEGVQCEACHGEVTADHPPSPVPILADNEYCGTCHTTTLSEWHRTGHATEGIGCSSCHDPHSQGPLFDNADDMCINCHQDSMGDYLEDLHIQNGIGCVDCHALVIPPDPLPVDGIVPTGHGFTITPATCVACHTDALHSGFHLPGYEQGARAASVDGELPVSLRPDETDEEQTDEGLQPTALTTEQQIQALEAALASERVTLIFQGALAGLVLGGTTAWFVSQNIRAGRQEDVTNGRKEE